jgi:hypothetical protein
MVIRTHARSAQRAMLNIEIAVAISILAIAVLPLAFMFAHEGKLLRAYYRNAVAMQILDGEMEVLAAGEWKRAIEGTQNYDVTARSATNLPPGKFTVTRNQKTLRLEWRPQKGTPMRREVTLP